MIQTPKRKSNTVFQVFLVILMLVLAFILIFSANYRFAKNNPGGVDFLYRWLPTRLILFEGFHNPYSPEVEYQVELIHHGHAHQGIETPGIFAYPYYIIPLYIPFAVIGDYITARAAWMTLLEVVNVFLVIITLRLIKIQVNKITLVFLLVFSLFFSFFTQAIIDGNPSPIATLFVLLSLMAISKQKDWLAGILLAFSTIKPQLVVLFFIVVWIWAFSHRRWRIILGSLITFTAMIGLSFAIQPNWFIEFLRDVLLYPIIASPHSPITIMNNWIPNSARWLSLLFTGFVIIILGREWIRVYNQNFISLFWTAILTFTLSPISGISSAHSNFIATLPGFVLLIAMLEQKPMKNELFIRLLPILMIIFSWSLFYIGRYLIINGIRLYYIDFLLLPLLFTPVLFWIRYFDDTFLFKSV